MSEAQLIKMSGTSVPDEREFPLLNPEVSIDKIYPQAVLEHVDDLSGVYGAMRKVVVGRRCRELSEEDLTTRSAFILAAVRGSQNPSSTGPRR
jgi:hypothetical protein